MSALSSGERAVWAAVFATRKDLGKSTVEAARLATLAVKDLRTLATPVHSDRLLDGDEDAKEMLADMLGVPR